MLVLVLLPSLAIAACHREERAVVNVEKNAEKAEHQAQVKAIERDQQRAELDQIALPTKSLYIDIHDPAQWANPFLSVGADTIGLRIIMSDANPSPVGEGTMLRPVAARRQELDLRLSDLDARRCGRHSRRRVALWPRDCSRRISLCRAQRSPQSVRRNVEAVIRQLNDLGVVVEEWPAR
jgi:hypothetical protein